jgi:nucleotide-binding universal stress UspA family protein
MAIKDITALVLSVESDRPALELARQLARAHGAHLNCAAIGVMPTPLLTYSELGVGEVYARVMQEGREAVREHWAKTEALFLKEEPPIELRRYEVFANEIEWTAARIARFADVVVVQSPSDAEPRHHADLIEGALLGGGRPVLVAPQKWPARDIGARVLLAWDGSREAARACHDALVLLQSGAAVFVVTVDAADAHSEGAGRDIATHLARHGLAVELRNLDSVGRSAAEALREAARDVDADLMIMGGYRHPRLQQAVVGGVTRTLLHDAKLPLLLSH